MRTFLHNKTGVIGLFVMLALFATACTGVEGQQGAQGPQGAQGAPGLPGLSSDAGLPGKPGLPGLPGIKGAKGDKGAPGATGPAGPVGTDAPPRQSANIVVGGVSASTLSYTAEIEPHKKAGTAGEGLVVLGSGFKAGEVVSTLLVLDKDQEYPLYSGEGVANDQGAFLVTTKGPYYRGRTPPAFVAGLYTVKVIGSEGTVATAPIRYVDEK